MSRETQTIERNPHPIAAPDGINPAASSPDPLGWLPRTTFRAVRLERLLARWTPDGQLHPALRWLDEATGCAMAFSRPEILWRASGLQRPSLVVQLAAARLGTRLGVGIEIPLAHAIVDRMLGFERAFAESRLQLSPVEWGIGTFVALRMIDALAAFAAYGRSSRAGIGGPLEPRDLSIDRVGPDPFDPTDLGTIVTVRWSVQAGDVTAAVRLWVPEPVVALWTASRPGLPAASVLGGHVEQRAEADLMLESPTHGAASSAPPPGAPAPIANAGPDRRVPRGELAAIWRAIAGEVLMPRGLARLRVGGVLPLSGSQLTGTPASPAGLIDLVLELDGQPGGFHMAASPVADSAARLVRIEARPTYQIRTRDPIAGTIQEGPRMTQPSPASATNPPTSAPAGPLDVPVTLTVELGRVNLTLAQLADLKPGDVVELARNSRAPVELTSNGRLVARGELILIDTDLGVRVTSVFL